MNILIWVLLLAAVAGFFIWKQQSLISPEKAREYLKQGALVIDVRTPGEFQADHLTQAINIPLGDLQDSLPQRVKDKNQVLLLHCLSGGRSEMAKHKLKGMGYPNSFNLGSLTRARKIVEEK